MARKELADLHGVDRPTAAQEDVAALKSLRTDTRQKFVRQLSSQLLIAQEHERERISRDIHDGLGQVLAAMKYRTENIIERINKHEPRTERTSVESLLPLIQNSIQETRRIQRGLRHPSLDELGIVATLGILCREFRELLPELTVGSLFDVDEEEVPLELKIHIYRIAQEALNNVAKHSMATEARLTLERRGDAVRLTITDNGIGFDNNEVGERAVRGLGLVSMKERAELSGGMLDIEARKNKGTSIHAVWPRDRS